MVRPSALHHTLVLRSSDSRHVFDQEDMRSWLGERLSRTELLLEHVVNSTEKSLALLKAELAALRGARDVYEL